MYELIQAAPSSYYIQCPAKIGVVRVGEGDVVLIDSGNDKDAAKKVRRHLDAQGWRLTAIFNTHSHADHIGGNQALQKLTGCKIYAPGVEAAFANHPILESTFLYGGNPPPDLRHKFLLAQPSDVETLTDAVLPDGLRAIPLPGHAFDMVGYRTKDDVVFLADCLSSLETLDKYQISFLVDVQASLDTLEMVKGMQAALFVPSHAEATEDIAPLAQANIDKIYEIADRLLSMLTEPICFDRLLQKVFIEYNLTMRFDQYALVGSTVRSYLAWLRARGLVDIVIEDQMLCWQRHTAE